MTSPEQKRMYFKILLYHASLDVMPPINRKKFFFNILSLEQF